MSGDETPTMSAVPKVSLSVVICVSTSAASLDSAHEDIVSIVKSLLFAKVSMIESTRSNDSDSDKEELVLEWSYAYMIVKQSSDGSL